MINGCERHNLAWTGALYRLTHQLYMPLNCHIAILECEGAGKCDEDADKGFKAPFYLGSKVAGLKIPKLLSMPHGLAEEVRSISYAVVICMGYDFAMTR